MTKILEISSYPPPHSGWSVRVAMIKQELIRLGHTCVVLNIGCNRKVKSTEYEDVQNGWDFVRKVFWYCAHGYRVHAHVNGQSNKGIVLTLLSQVINILFGQRSILTFHAGTNQTYFPRHKKWYYFPFFFLIFALSETIICNDDEVKRRISEYGVRTSKIFPIPAFSLQYLQFQESTLAAELEFFFRQRSPVLATYSLLRPAFHLDTTLRALATLKTKWPQIGLIMIGSTQKTEDMDAKTIFRVVDELGLQNCIYWAGDLPHDKFLTVLKRSKIYVRSYVYDGVSSSVLEALSMGIPVVGCENELRPRQVVIFKTGDAQDLAAKIDAVLENYDEILAGLSPPKIRNTIAEEVNLLVGSDDV
ncbi:MAG: glycosyltransferase [candidate division KSB1 bacterium]|nr:glycosyltransferase [candidate division KSB1 bacterium]MDZ7368185.1 glycosyltransferase [candidate division KSB1 bacterium]MDZ7405924.1 glycosyltransferase [candidate division KSB1 bacterium]